MFPRRSARVAEALDHQLQVDPMPSSTLFAPRRPPLTKVADQRKSTADLAASSMRFYSYIRFYGGSGWDQPCAPVFQQQHRQRQHANFLGKVQ